MAFLPKTHLDPGEGVVTPWERDGQFTRFLATFNGGLDGENLPDGQVTHAKLAWDWQYNGRTSHTTSRTRTVTEANNATSLEPIPESDDSDWIQDFDTDDDADVHVLLRGSVQTSTGTDVASFVHVAVELDGAVIAHTDVLGSRLQVACYLLDCRWPVVAGSHRLRYLWGWQARVPSGFTQDVIFHERSSLVLVKHR